MKNLNSKSISSNLNFRALFPLIFIIFSSFFIVLLLNNKSDFENPIYLYVAVITLLLFIFFSLKEIFSYFISITFNEKSLYIFNNFKKYKILSFKEEFQYTKFGISPRCLIIRTESKNLKINEYYISNYNEIKDYIVTKIK